ncbi:FAD/NAD-P-binding domain-containing protein [Mycena alexandri]|uniref:FAD/NAD-P-binding domain-containing protein n=1 Tax=Mycena alexandri TaxID=1745969 RepID=A0AAD6WQS0_9AGAR|nr:FAD/NAD-P-binding domain-containing protein [Mycena alexandri]
MAQDPRTPSVAIVGSGAAGLITAYTLLQDGFSQVQVLTRESTVGGVWSAERVYPGLQINNVHGEYGFSALEMPPSTSGGRLMGQDLRAYMEAFSTKFLDNIIRFNTEVTKIRRDERTSLWFVSVEDKNTGSREVLEFSRIVLCTGGCNTPKVPKTLSPDAAKRAGFRGPVIHSKDFAVQLDTILETVPRISPEHAKSAVIVGGGKSAQDMAAYLANEGRKVTVVFETADAFVASPMPLPGFIRKSRLLSVMAGHSVLRSRLERFLHGTYLGSKITRGFWSALNWASLSALSVKANSPLHNTHPLFWTTSVNDEGVPQANRFHALVAAGKIEVIAPVRMDGFGSDGKSVTLSDGRAIDAHLVLLATGYSSSWTGIFDEDTAELVGMNGHTITPRPTSQLNEGNYYSLLNPPSHPESEIWASSIYNGIVPAKNIARRDLAINGAVFTTNAGYTWEVIAHWISSYFLGDKMTLPATPEEAYAHTERNAVWIRKRYPGVPVKINESFSSVTPFWTWPQYTDQLLEEMGLRSMRSGGNWLTWPFTVISMKEIATLGEERREKRLG